MVRINPSLAVTDSLLWSKPDSAFSKLLSFADSPKADSLDAFNGHYFQLLLSELLYKNYAIQTNRIELLRSVDYFDSLVKEDASCNIFDLAFLDARAHHINGVGYYERDSLVPACEQYLKSLMVMEEHFSEEELIGKKAQFMALTYTHLSDLFSNQYLHEQAIDFGMQSLPYYSRYEGKPWHVSWVLEEIGIHYDMLEILDSADYYYQKAVQSLDDTNNLIYRDIETHSALLSYKVTKNPSIPLRRLFRMRERSESCEEECSRCLTIGAVYYYEHQFDSAWFFLNKAFLETKSMEAKRQAAEWLVKIGKSQGRSFEQYLDFLVPFVNREENQSGVKSLLIELHRDRVREMSEKLHRQIVKRQMEKTMMLFGILVSLLLVLFALNRTNKRKKNRLESILLKERYAHRVQQSAIGGRLRESNMALSVQKKENQKLQEEIKTKQDRKEWSSYEDFMSEDVCQLILETLRNEHIKREAKSVDYPQLRLDVDQLAQLEVAVEKHFNGFGSFLTTLYPRINQNEKTQCCLCLLNLHDTQIAALLNKDYSTIRKRSAKLRKAFSTDKTLQLFIMGLVSY